MDFQQIRDFVNPAVAQATGLQEVENLAMPVPVAYVPVQLVIDGALSLTSENPVQNKVIAVAIQNLDGRITAIEGQFSEGVTEAVNNWLAAHPEATTTVQDGSIAYAKLDNNLKGEVDQISDLKSAIAQHETIIDDQYHTISGELVQGNYHETSGDVRSVTFIGNDSAFGTCKYADRKNIAPKMTYNDTKYGVSIVGSNRFIELNGTASSSNTFLISYIDFTPYLTAGDYKFVTNIDAGASQLASGGQWVYTIYYANGNKSESKWHNRNNAEFIITATEPVRRIAISGGVLNGNVYDQYRMWFGVFNGDVTITDTENTVAAGDEYVYVPENLIGAFDTMQHQSTAEYLENIKEYVDAIDPDINKQLTYVTPEKYGAVGDGEHDDYNALVSCIQYAISNNVPVRANKKYFISTGLVIECDNLDLFINQIITRTTSGDVIKLTGYRNRISINYIYAYDGNCNGFHLYGKAAHWSEFNVIHIPCIYAKQIAILVDAEDATAYACENTFYTQYLRSENADCIYIGSGFGENAFYGGGQIICPNGWAITCYNVGNKFYNFALESLARSGIRINGYNNHFIGFRIAELRGQKTPTSGDVGTLLKFIGTSFANVFECADAINYIDIDVSEATTNSELTPAQSNISACNINVIKGTGVRSNGYVDGAPKSGFYTIFGAEMYTLRNNKIVTPYMNYTKSITADVDYTGVAITPLPTAFKIESAATIKLNASYCCIGFNEITIDQTEAQCTILDKNGATIFDGTTLGSGVYRLLAEVDPEHNIFKTLHPDYDGDVIMYDGENDLWIVTKIS